MEQDYVDQFITMGPDAFFSQESWGTVFELTDKKMFSWQDAPGSILHVPGLKPRLAHLGQYPFTKDTLDPSIGFKNHVKKFKRVSNAGKKINLTTDITKEQFDLVMSRQQKLRSDWEKLGNSYKKLQERMKKLG